MAPPPMKKSEIRTVFMREHVTKLGCCGLDELIKIYAWTLTEFDRFVHLDIDTLVLANMKELFDINSPLLYTYYYVIRL